MTDKAFTEITGRTPEQNAARELIRDKVEALRVRVLDELKAIGAEAEAFECFRDEALDEFGCHANRVAESVDTEIVSRAFSEILGPIYEWRPR